MSNAFGLITIWVTDSSYGGQGVDSFSILLCVIIIRLAQENKHQNTCLFPWGSLTKKEN